MYDIFRMFHRLPVQENYIGEALHYILARAQRCIWRCTIIQTKLTDCDSRCGLSPMWGRQATDEPDGLSNIARLCYAQSRQMSKSVTTQLLHIRLRHKVHKEVLALILHD